MALSRIRKASGRWWGSLRRHQNQNDDSCDNKAKNSVTEENGISSPSISARSQGTTGSLCYVCILVVPIAITVASLLLYNYTSIISR